MCAGVVLHRRILATVLDADPLCARRDADLVMVYPSMRLRIDHWREHRPEPYMAEVWAPSSG
jgi:hypothetical protein